MKKQILFFLILFSLGVAWSAHSKQFLHYNNEQSDFVTFYDWKRACDALPSYKKNVSNPCKTVLNEAILTSQIDIFLETMTEQVSKLSWVNGSKPKIPSDNFQAYVEKLVVPKDAVIAVHGDFHGDINALNRFIETFQDRGYLDESDPFKIKSDNFYMLFLGDYVDRGWYGSEVLYAILRLKNENPDRVFFTRGNHEDLDLNTHYGFVNELKHKFSFSIVEKIQALYNSFPVALYLGADNGSSCNYIQCCHGGIELGYNPQQLLKYPGSHVGQRIDMLMQKDAFMLLDPLEVHPLGRYFNNNKRIDTSNGFMWSDFFVDPDMQMSLSPRDGYAGSIFVYGKNETCSLLQAWSRPTHTIRAIFRAHQHSDQLMRDRFFNHDNLGHSDDKGVAKLWIENDLHHEHPALLDDIAVVTFSVAPETGYGWPIHSFGELHIKPEYKDWHLYVYQLEV